MDLNHLRCIKSCRESDWDKLHQGWCQIPADYITLIPSLFYWSLVVILSLVEFPTTKFRAKQINKVLQDDHLDGITNQDINKRLLESVQDNERAFKVYVT